MWFVTVSPATFFSIMLVALLGSMLMVVLNAIEDSDAEREARERRANPVNPFEDMQKRLEIALRSRP
jgi:hypothetical protein